MVNLPYPMVISDAKSFSLYLFFLLGHNQPKFLTRLTAFFSKWHVIRMIFRLRTNIAPLFDFYCFWKSQARLEFNRWIRPDWDPNKYPTVSTNTKSWEYFTDNLEHSTIKTYNCIQFIHFFHNAVNRFSKKVHYCKLI